MNFLDLEEQGLYSRTSLVVDYDPHDHGDSFDAVVILIIQTIQLFEHPTFSRKNKCIPSIQTPTLEIIIPIYKHLHLAELEWGSLNVY